MPYALRLVEQPNGGPASARNLGVREARALLIVFVDDDVVPDEELLAAHLAAHAPDASDNVVAIGPLLPPPDTRLNAWGEWEERTLCKLYDEMERALWQPSYHLFYTGNASLARRHILDAGGFDPAFRRAEDIELGYQLSVRGNTFAYLPHARGWHYVHRSFASWIHMPRDYASASVAIGRNGRTEDVARDLSFYAYRNAAVRFTTRLCLGRPRRVAFATQALHVAAVAGWACRLAPVASLMCSVVYNLRYYDSMAAKIGGAETFWRLVKLAGKHTAADGKYEDVLAALEQALGTKDNADENHLGDRLEMEAGV
jgi:glycosyltransferase involved in cell wall biosynthesis